MPKTFEVFKNEEDYTEGEVKELVTMNSIDELLTYVNNHGQEIRLTTEEKSPAIILSAMEDIEDEDEDEAEDEDEDEE